MRFGCPQLDAVVLQAYPGMPRCALAFLQCSGFPPPHAALVTVASGKKGLWVVLCNSGEDRVKEKGREIRNDRIQKWVRIIDVWWWALILSLGSGDGFPLLVGLYEVCQ